MTRARTMVAAAAGCVAWAGAGALAAETTIKNDSVNDGTQATICPCFVQGEEAAVWLTSPCDGDIVAIQIFWRSLLGGEPDAVEQSINVYAGGTFPDPGPLRKELLAPLLTDGVLNEYRFEDEQQTIPIQIPVTAGEEFVVALEFFNDSPPLGPSIVFDSDGIIPGKNTVKVNGSEWKAAESLGVTGDWFIRVVIDCTEALTGACCLAFDTCVENVDEVSCVTGGGEWLGAGTGCAGSPCAALTGACCLPGGCLALTQADCAIAGGSFLGITSACVPGACVPACSGDVDGDGDVDVFDFADLAEAFGSSSGGASYNPDADLNGDGSVDVFDFADLAEDFGCGL